MHFITLVYIGHCIMHSEAARLGVPKSAACILAVSVAILLHCTLAEEKSLVQTFYIACVWCFMTFKWSMLLLSNAITDDRSSIDACPGSVNSEQGSDDSVLQP